VFLADTSFSSSETYINNELLPIFKNLTIDYIVIAGGLTSTDNAADASLLISKLSPYCKSIYWIPGGQDDNSFSTFANLTSSSDRNLQATYLSPANNLYLAGYGGLEVDTPTLSALVSGIPLSATSSLILLTYTGPSNVDTTEVRSQFPSSLEPPTVFLSSSSWTDVGNPNVTNLISQTNIQANLILTVHGNNPGGAGGVRFGEVQIVNPGAAMATRSFAMVEIDPVGAGGNGTAGWFVNNWRFYRYGNVTAWGGLTAMHDVCKISSVSVAAPYTQTALSRAAIAMFVIFLVSIIGGFMIFVGTGKAV